MTIFVHHLEAGSHTAVVETVGVRQQLWLADRVKHNSGCLCYSKLADRYKGAH